MTDAMLRQVLAQISAELRENREYMQSLTHDVSVVSGVCMRIEAQVGALREDHDSVCIEIAQTDKAIARRISHIEDQARWVKGWAAGAMAVVMAAGSTMVWLVSQFGGK